MANHQSTSGPAVPRYVGRGPNGTLTKEEARRLLAEQAGSGLTLQAFALGKGLVPQRLSWWKTKLPGRDPSRPELTSATFLPVAVEPARTPARPGAKPAAIPSPPGAFGLGLADGRTLHIPPDFEATSLARLLRVLGEVR